VNTPAARRPGWYVWDYDRGEVVRGPYKSSETAGAVRSEIEGDRNLWIVHHRTLRAWEAELARA
jgi:hypothetical protein